MKAKRAKLLRVLAGEVAEWNQKPYAELLTFDYPVVYEREISGGDPKAYQVEVELLEKSEQYVQISVAVDDGGISAFCPPSYSLVIHAQATDSST